MIVFSIDMATKRRCPHRVVAACHGCCVVSAQRDEPGDVVSKRKANQNRRVGGMRNATTITINDS
jgi:hypothetical protein